MIHKIYKISFFHLVNPVNHVQYNSERKNEMNNEQLKEIESWIGRHKATEFSMDKGHGIGL